MKPFNCTPAFLLLWGVAPSLTGAGDIADPCIDVCNELGASVIPGAKATIGPGCPCGPPPAPPPIGPPRPLFDTANPRELAIDARTPFLAAAETNASAQWCAPGHHRPWVGQWAFDIWRDNGVPNNSTVPNPTCGEDVYLRVSPSSLPLGTVPDSLRAKVINVSSHEFACGSQVYSHGGYQQAFEIYATYRGQEVALGWVLYAHIDDRVYDFGDWIDDIQNTRIGTAFEGGSGNPDCWGSCHVHMEFKNYEDTSCYQNVCQNLPEEGIPVWGEGSIVGKLGGNLGSVQVCPTYTDEEKLPCATWDNDLTGCDQHGLFDPNPGNDTQDCAYYFGADTCRPRGTANCAAEIWQQCDDFDSEDWVCSTWDGDVSGCDQHGLFDSDPTNDTQDCAYYLTSDRCSGRGQSNCAAGIPCF